MTAGSDPTLGPGSGDDDLSEFPAARGGDRHGTLHLSELAGRRWEVALERLAEGGSIAFDDVAFRLVGPDRILLRPAWTDRDPPTLARANHAFDRAAVCLETLMRDPDFARITADRVADFELFEDYRTGALIRADRRDGQTRLR